MAPLLSYLPNTFTTGFARDRAVDSRDLSRLVEQQEVMQLSRGVYRKTAAPKPTHPDLLAVAFRCPQGIICGLTAASVHGLIDDTVTLVQITLPTGKSGPHIDSPPTQTWHVRPENHELGLTHIDAAKGEPIRIYDPARTVTDLIRQRNTVGEDIAYGALHRALGSGAATPADLMFYAKRLNVAGVMRQAVTILSAAA